MGVFDMKKFLSALIILAMALTLSLSLASCNTNEAVGTNTVQAETKAFTDPPAMDEIKDIIYNVFGYEAFDAPLYSDRDDSLIGLYSTNYERYIAYIMVDNDYGEYTYALVLYDAMGIEIDRYFLNSADGGVDQNRLDHACRRAGNFVGTHYNTEDHTATFLRELIVYICRLNNINLI